MSLAQFLGYSQHLYKFPIRPRQGEVIRFWNNKLSHVGRDRHAKDIIVPDPRENPLQIYAPQSGVVIALVQNNSLWGRSQDFARFKNYVQVQVSGNEFYLLAHIRVLSCPFKIGDHVTINHAIAETGVNGWMTDPRHLHFVVGLLGQGSLRIRWDKNQEYASAK